ncbi:MAG: 1-acyl-sn-glycerol-3-phosphate acyltransferase [Firmicutes bacterium]|nr:1-acyl-sn-glycerol-3-phosphate acyltransferase [Bacillota bacterium]
MLFRHFMKIFTWPFYVLLFWPKRYNKQYLRQLRGKPYVLVANHKSNMDIVVMFHAIPRKLGFIGKESLGRRAVPRWFFTKLGYFPVKKDNGLAVVRYSLSILEKNRVMMIFPEGMRVFNPEEALALRNGASMIAIKGGVPVLPCVINRAARPFRRTKIKFGPPICTEKYQGKRVCKNDLAELSDTIRDTLRDMLRGFEHIPKKHAWDAEPVDVARGIVLRHIPLTDGETTINRGMEGYRHELLLIKRVRPGVNNGEPFYVFPGGHLDGNEMEMEAVTRELREECGIEIRPTRTIYKSHREVGSRGDKPEMEAFLTCEYISGDVKMSADADEAAPGAETETWFDGNPRGTYEPMWVDLEAILETDMPVYPEKIANQLRTDITELGYKLVRRSMYVK